VGSLRFEMNDAAEENERRAVGAICYSAPPVLVGCWPRPNEDGCAPHFRLRSSGALRHRTYAQPRVLTIRKPPDDGRNRRRDNLGSSECLQAS